MYEVLFIYLFLQGMSTRSTPITESPLYMLRVLSNISVLLNHSILLPRLRSRTAGGAGSQTAVPDEEDDALQFFPNRRTVLSDPSTHLFLYKSLCQGSYKENDIYLNYKITIHYSSCVSGTCLGSALERKVS